MTEQLYLDIARDAEAAVRELIEAAHACGIRVHAWFTSASDAAQLNDAGVTYYWVAFGTSL